MSKGSYSVGEDDKETPTRRDTSYRSFICALLAFLAICVVILLVTIAFGRRHDSNKTSGANVSEQKGERKNETHTSTSTTLIHKLTTAVVQEIDRKTTTPVLFTTEQQREVPITETTLKPVKSITVTPTILKQGEPTTVAETTLKPAETTRTTIQLVEHTTRSIDEETETKLMSTSENPEDETQAGVSKRQELPEATTSGIQDVTQDQTSTTDVSPEVTPSTDIRSTTDSPSYKLTTNEIIEISADSETTTILSTIFTRATTSGIQVVGEDQTSSTDDTSDITPSDDIRSTTDFPRYKLTTNEITETSADTETETATILSTTSIFTRATKSGSQDVAENQTSPTDVSYGITPSADGSTTDAPSSYMLTTNEITDTSTDPATEIAKSTTSPSTTATTEMVTTSTTTEVSLMESEAVTETKGLRMISLKKMRNPVCEKAVCKTAASQMLSSMNHSAVPCEDFYDFACGRFSQIQDPSQSIEATVLEKQLNSFGYSSSVRTFAKFHSSCLLYDNYFDYRKRMDGVEDLLAQVGEFQFDNTTSPNDLTEIVAELLLRQSMPLFDVGIDVDKESSNFILQLTLPHQSFLRAGVEDWSGLSLQKRRCLAKLKSRIRGSRVNLSDIYSSYHDCQNDHSNYINSVESVVRELNAFSNLTADSLLAEIKNIRFSIEFDVLNNLDLLPSSADILTNFIKKDYEMRPLSNLQRHYPLFDWKKLFEILTGRQVHGEMLVQVYFAKYFKSTFASLGKIDKRILNNAFLAIHAYDLFVNTVLPKEESNRHQFCTKLTKQLLPDVWSHYAQITYSVEEQKNRNRQVLELFRELKRNFCKSLTDAAWIDDMTKTAVVKKCNQLELDFYEPPVLNDLYQNYGNINTSLTFQANLIALLINYKRNVYSKQGSHISAKTIFSYFLDPFGSRALTFYANSTIMVPLGLMDKAPPGLPNYLTLVRVGFNLARQMARHFDPTGIQYGIKLASTSETTYFNLVDSMTTMMQYSSPRLFHGKNISFQLVGSLSNNERIVDNIAFRLVFDSFKLSADSDILPWISSQFSREKVFFIATAQEFCEKTTLLDFMLQVFERRHLPAVLRVENIMGNSEEFANTFFCAEGSGMNLWFEKFQFPFLSTVEDEYNDQGAVFN